MLVVDPVKRFNMGQVKKHHWMLVEAPVTSFTSEALVATSSSTVTSSGDHPSVPVAPTVSNNGASEQVNEQILRLMQSLGVDPVKTKESVLHQRYDHHAAIYYLLLERKIHLSSMSTAATEVAPQINKTAARPVAAESPPIITPPVPVAAATAVAASTSRQRPALWSHNPPFRDSACGDSVDSERGSVGGSFLSPLMETAPSAIAGDKIIKSNTYSVDEGVEDWSDAGQSPLGSYRMKKNSQISPLSVDLIVDTYFR